MGKVECLDESICNDVSVVLRGSDSLGIEYNIVSKGSYLLSNLGRNNRLLESEKRNIPAPQVESTRCRIYVRDPTN